MKYRITSTLLSTEQSEGIEDIELPKGAIPLRIDTKDAFIKREYHVDIIERETRLYYLVLTEL